MPGVKIKVQQRHPHCKEQDYETYDPPPRLPVRCRHRIRICCSDRLRRLLQQLIRLADGRQVNLILTTGGTGFAPRDITPEATYAVADRNAPGIAEAMRYHSLSITPRGMLSRAASVLRGKTLIVNLPGSPKAVKENLEYILPSLEHGVRIAAGLDGECARK